MCAPALAHEPRPIVQIGASAPILIIGQAPGSRVQASGIPWDDPSGDRLREWTGLTKADFYDPGKVALMPMGFCYPGKGKSGDLPPRRECAPLWHEPLLAALPRRTLTLLVGRYAQARYSPETRDLVLADAMREDAGSGSARFLLPHPSWRSTGWMKANPWFEADILSRLKAAIGEALKRSPT